MKILMVNYEYPPLGGGGGVATRDLAVALAEKHTVHVVTTLPGVALQKEIGSIPKYELRHGVHVHRVPVLRRTNGATATLVSMVTFVPMALRMCLSLTSKETFDVINAQFVLPSGLPAAMVAKWRTIPFVLSFIGGDLFDPSKGTSPHRHGVLRWLVRAISRQAVVATAISEDTKQRARSLHGVQVPIEVTHLGLIPTEVSLSAKRDMRLPPQGPLAVSVGRLITRKGYMELIRAWADIPDAHLAIIGDGPLRVELSRHIEALGLTDRVHLLGFLSEEAKLQMLQSADVYVSAAQHEGFGIVFLEAMAAGLPIVTTNNGGHTDFLREGRNALLVNPGDEAALHTALTKVLGDSALREELRQHNLEDVREYFIDKTAARFEAVLMRAAQAKLSVCE